MKIFSINNDDETISRDDLSLRFMPRQQLPVHLTIPLRVITVDSLPRITTSEKYVKEKIHLQIFAQ